MMFTQHAVFAHPHAEGELEQQAEGADSEQQANVTDDTAPQTEDTASDNQDDPSPDWSVPHTGTFLRFYSQNRITYTQKRET
jgi:hypothetical protein